MKIEDIPTEELIKDRRESIKDIQICTAALSLNIINYSGGKTQGRLNVNKSIVMRIDKELERRNETEKKEGKL